MVAPKPPHLFDYVVRVGFPSAADMLRSQLAIPEPIPSPSNAGNPSHRTDGAFSTPTKSSGDSGGDSVSVNIPVVEYMYPPEDAIQSTSDGMDDDIRFLLSPSSRKEVERERVHNAEREIVKKQVPQFCFPEGFSRHELRTPKSVSKSQVRRTLSAATAAELPWTPDAVHASSSSSLSLYTFTLTMADGSRLYGFCHRLQLEDHRRSMPECLCILTRYPWFRVFNTVLVVLLARVNMQQPLEPFLKAVYELPMPEPGADIVVEVVESADIALSTPLDSTCILSHRPLLDEEELSVGTSLFSLFTDTELRVEDVVKIFGACMEERRILIFSDRLDILSNCMHALCSLLYPFKWQHIFIPVLPKALQTYAAAPMPFLIGAPAALKPSILGGPGNNSTGIALEDVVLVDLDSGSVVQRNGSSGDVQKSQSTSVVDEPYISPLPKEAEHHLISEISEYLGSHNGRKDISSHLSDCFLRFHLLLFSRYREYMFRHSPTSARSLNVDALISGISRNGRMSDVKRFLETFRETQMCEVFAREREFMMQNHLPPSGRFELEVHRLYPQSYGKISLIQGLDVVSPPSPQNRSRSSTMNTLGSTGSGGGGMYASSESESEHAAGGKRGGKRLWLSNMKRSLASKGKIFSEKSKSVVSKMRGKSSMSESSYNAAEDLYDNVDETRSSPRPLPYLTKLTPSKVPSNLRSRIQNSSSSSSLSLSLSDNIHSSAYTHRATKSFELLHAEMAPAVGLSSSPPKKHSKKTSKPLPQIPSRSSESPIESSLNLSAIDNIFAEAQEIRHSKAYPHAHGKPPAPGPGSLSPSLSLSPTPVGRSRAGSSGISGSPLVDRVVFGDIHLDGKQKKPESAKNTEALFGFEDSFADTLNSPKLSSETPFNTYTPPPTHNYHPHHHPVTHTTTNRAINQQGSRSGSVNEVDVFGFATAIPSKEKKDVTWDELFK